MKRHVIASLVCVALAFSASAFAQGVVFNSIPSPTPPNVPSQGFQCCQTAEIGDEILLDANTPRFAGTATVLMSSWSLHSDYPLMDAAGYTHPITLNIYTDAASAAAHQPVKTVTQNFLIPWRPVADPTCPTPTAWRSPTDNKCYNGFAFTITFDLKSLSYVLPNQFIYGVAFNTDSWGYDPIGGNGPYQSLNVGLANVAGLPVLPSVGIDVDTDVVFWNTGVAAWYTDGGTGGVGIFRPDTGWTPFPVAVRFTTFGFPTTTSSCKNGAWANLVRTDFTVFKNQGACVSYTKTGK